MSDFGEYLRKLGTADPGEKAVGDIIPLARNAEGKLHLALPEGVRSMLRGVADADEAGRHGIPVGQIASPDLTNMIMALGMGAGAGFGPKAVGNEAVSGIFAGKRAIPREKLQQVGPLTKAGYSPEEVFDKTGGVHLGAEGAPRIEIPDPVQTPKLPWDLSPHKGAVVSPEGKMKVPASGIYAGDAIEHPELFSKYPELAQMPLERRVGSGGEYDPEGGIIYLGDTAPKDMYSTILHELQHAVQHIEGHSEGGNSDMFFNPQMRELRNRLRAPWDAYSKYRDFNELDPVMLGNLLSTKTLAEITPELRNSPELAWIRGLEPDQRKKFVTDFNQHVGATRLDAEAYKMYKALAGETEARNTEYRLGGNVPAHTRGDPKYPWNTADVLPEDQLVWSGSNYDPDKDISQYLLKQGKPAQSLEERSYELLKFLK
jgi:hypothetical protein